MWRLVNSIPILLCLFGRANFLSAQEIQLEKPTNNESRFSPNQSDLDENRGFSILQAKSGQLSCNDRTKPAFWDNLSFLPIRFINRHKESGILTGQFASPDVISIKQLEFKLVPESKEEKGLFFRPDKGWEKEINRKTFLERFKKDFWLISYLTIDEERIVCDAHQFQNWQSLVVSYAQGSKNYNVKTEEFWTNLKSIPAYFQEIKENSAFWLFILDIGNMPVPEYSEPIRLQNGVLVNRYLKFNDGNLGVVLDNDFFTIDKNCVFHVIEKKDPKLIKIPKIKITQFELGSQKIRVKPVDREYFVKNALEEPRQPWLCFYERDFENKLLLLLRAISMPIENGSGKKNSNDKNQNGKNSKNNNNKNGENHNKNTGSR